MILSSPDPLICETIPALLQVQAERNGPATALRCKNKATGEWVSLSWLAYFQQTQQIHSHLVRLGLQPGQTVGILAPSSLSWDLMQVGALAARSIVVGLDPADPDDRINHVARLCGFSGVALQCIADLQRFNEKVRQRFKFIIVFERSEVSGEGLALADLLSIEPGAPQPDVSEAQPDDAATIIFTSGTTGEPKGIQFSHRQICLAIAAIRTALPDISSDYRLACWLPLSNMFQRIINFLAMSCGAQTWYVSSPQTLMQEIREIEPHLFIGVPRFYEKLYQGMVTQLDSASGWQRRISTWALDVGHSYQADVRRERQPGPILRLQHLVADWLVLRQLRQVMGRNLRYMVSGSAPMPGWLLENFHAMGLLVLEAYGLSENVIPNAINTPRNFRFGTVGRPLSGCELKQAADGELLVRGPGVVAHYYTCDQALRDAEGFLATGDFGSVDKDGYICLHGRKSEIIKTSTGRRIAPAPVEAVLLQHPLVEQVIVAGERQAFLTAIIVLPGSSAARLQASAEHCCKELEALLQALPPYSRPAGLVFTTRAFSVEAGELTGNLKLRRGVIHAHYRQALESAYQLVTAHPREGRRLEKFDHDDNTVLCKL